MKSYSGPDRQQQRNTDREHFGNMADQALTRAPSLGQRQSVGMPLSAGHPCTSQALTNLLPTQPSSIAAFGSLDSRSLRASAKNNAGKTANWAVVVPEQDRDKGGGPLQRAEHRKIRAGPAQLCCGAKVPRCAQMRHCALCCATLREL